MKKFLSIALAMVMVLSLAACAAPAKQEAKVFKHGFDLDYPP